MTVRPMSALESPLEGRLRGVPSHLLRNYECFRHITSRGSGAEYLAPLNMEKVMIFLRYWGRRGGVQRRRLLKATGWAPWENWGKWVPGSVSCRAGGLGAAFPETRTAVFCLDGLPSVTAAPGPPPQPGGKGGFAGVCPRGCGSWPELERPDSELESDQHKKGGAPPRGPRVHGPQAPGVRARIHNRQ